MSVVEACDEAVQHATTACAGFAALIDEAKIDVYRFAGLADTLSQDTGGSTEGEKKILTRVDLTNQAKSIHRAVILDKEDEWDQRQLTLAGVREVIITFDGRVAGAAGMPATKLFGKAPDGMNATGEGDDKNYFQQIGSMQETDLRPGMERIDAVMLPSAGVKAALTWNFSPLRVLTEQEAAEIENKEADTASKYANAGLIPESALAKSVQNRLIESQRWPGLQHAIEEAEAAGEELPEDPADLGVVSIGKPAGAQVTSGSGNRVEGRRRAANDAQPRTLYVSRPVVNVAEIKAWAKAQGLPPVHDDLHVTLIYSRAPLDWIKAGNASEWGEKDGKLTIPPGGPRAVEPLGDQTAVILFASSELCWRHKSIVEAGAAHDYDDFQPHISLTAEPVELSNVEPYRGRIVLGPEIFEEISE
jgi:hypothetical protein